MNESILHDNNLTFFETTSKHIGIID